jgi:threonine dehydratase
MTVSRADIEAAHRRIREHVRETPVLEVAAGTFGLEVPLVLKLELLQHTARTPRGAPTTSCRAGSLAAGVVAASGGNH